MSATIKYRKLDDDPVLPIGGRSNWLEKMQDIFGNPPWIISEKNLVQFATLNKILGEDEATNIIMKMMGSDGNIEIYYIY